GSHLPSSVPVSHGLPQRICTSRGPAALHGLANLGVGADFVVAAVSVALQGEIAGINVSYQAFTNHNLVEQSLAHGHNPAVKAYSAAVPDHGNFHIMGLQRDFGLQLLKGGLIDMDPANVVAQQKFFRIAAGVSSFHGLEGKYIE